MKIRLFLYVALTFAAAACGGSSNDNVFGVRTRLDAKPELCSVNGSLLELEGEAPIGIISMFASDSVLLLKTANPKAVFQMHAFSLEDKSDLGEYIAKGRGPRELLSPIVKGNFEDGEVYLFDLSLCASYDFNLKKSMANGNTELSQLIKLPPRTVDAYPFGDGHIAFIPEDKSYTCAVMDAAGAIQKRISLFPGVSGDAYFDKLSSACVVNQSSRKLAMAMLMFPQVNILDIDDEKRMTAAVSAEYRNWQKILNSDDDGRQICYTSITQSPYYFMALYFGTSFENWAEGKVIPHVHVFDWNGHFMYDIIVPENLKTITYNTSTRMLYGADREDKIYQYDLLGILSEASV